MLWCSRLLGIPACATCCAVGVFAHSAVLLDRGSSQYFPKISDYCHEALVCIGILFVGVLADVGAHQLRRNRINSRAVKLGDACLAYRAKYNHYPEQLDDLEPEFISSVQPATATFLGEDDFHYSSHDGPEPFIYDECLPPFGHCYYYVESRCWRYLD
jgi:hypothetical protein